VVEEIQYHAARVVAPDVHDKGVDAVPVRAIVAIHVAQQAQIVDDFTAHLLTHLRVLILQKLQHGFGFSGRQVLRAGGAAVTEGVQQRFFIIFTQTAFFDEQVVAFIVAGIHRFYFINLLESQSLLIMPDPVKQKLITISERSITLTLDLSRHLGMHTKEGWVAKAISTSVIPSPEPDGFHTVVVTVLMEKSIYEEEKMPPYTGF
jgi:hypothetical protein